jgi:hypothetical protein
MITITYSVLVMPVLGQSLHRIAYTFIITMYGGLNEAMSNSNIQGVIKDE